ncbi:hypothetical protein SLEP1_g34398 [Rubroshorea leprosula]|uniref:DUF4283 domain-containing protein n=1 Tax=Rubroshorea leprosula TaxID=152421 RepID=A0AAV5KJP5_9ROSI|nr:hypothetical protein SLEP1_g34398 [Rubroshorea leprosula]
MGFLGTLALGLIKPWRWVPWNPGLGSLEPWRGVRLNLGTRFLGTQPLGSFEPRCGVPGNLGVGWNPGLGTGFLGTQALGSRTNPGAGFVGTLALGSLKPSAWVRTNPVLVVSEEAKRGKRRMNEEDSRKRMLEEEDEGKIVILPLPLPPIHLQSYLSNHFSSTPLTSTIAPSSSMKVSSSSLVLNMPTLKLKLTTFSTPPKPKSTITTSSTHRVKDVTLPVVTAPPSLPTSSVPQLEPSPNVEVQNPSPLKSFKDTLVTGSVQANHPLCEIDMIDLGLGCYTVKFTSMDDRHQAPKIAIWVHFPKLPTEYYEEPILGLLGNKVGRTISVDETTLLATHSQYAKVCVKVDLTEQLVSMIDFYHGVDLTPMLLTVAYDLNNVCFHCGEFGHKKTVYPYQQPLVVGDLPSGIAQKPVLVKSANFATPAKPYGSWMIIRDKPRRQSNQIPKIQISLLNGNSRGNRFEAIFNLEMESSSVGKDLVIEVTPHNVVGEEISNSKNLTQETFRMELVLKKPTPPKIVKWAC